MAKTHILLHQKSVTLGANKELQFHESADMSADFVIGTFLGMRITVIIRLRSSARIISLVIRTPPHEMVAFTEREL